jgi:hypothetical protein
MAIIVRSGGNFVPAPEGAHVSVCADVVDHGVLKVVFQGKEQQRHKISLVWQLSEDMDNGKPYLVRRRYTASLHEKSSLRRDLESWRGRGFTSSELEAFDLESLIGIGCLINVLHEIRGGVTYANVSSIMRLPKGMVAPVVRDYVRIIDRPPAQTDTTEDGLGNLGISDDDVPF